MLQELFAVRNSFKTAMKAKQGVLGATCAVKAGDMKGFAILLNGYKNGG